MSTCSVTSCRNHRRLTTLNKKNISYHRFPRNEDIRQKWLRVIRPSKSITENHYVCSAHFLEDDFERNLQAELLSLPKKRKLKPTAIPSLYMNESDNDNIEDTIKKISPVVTYEYCVQKAAENPSTTSEPDMKYKAIIHRIDTLEPLNNESLTSQETVLLNSKNVPCLDLGKDSNDDLLLDIGSKNSTLVVNPTTNIADDVNDTERSKENQEYFLEECNSITRPEMPQDMDKQKSYSEAEDNIRCRTCLEDVQTCYFLTDVAHPTKTIKEMIIFCIPQMESTLSDDDVICNKCLDAIKFCVKFHENCLEVEEKLKTFNKENSGDDLETCIPSNTVDYVKIDHDYVMKSEPETGKCKDSAYTQPNILENLVANQRYTNPNIDKNQQQSYAQLFKCPSCDRILKSQKLLVNHIIRVHGKMLIDDEPQGEEFLQITDQEMFPCSRCEKLFKTENYLLIHLRKVHNLFKQPIAKGKKGVLKKVGKKYVCKFCKCSFLREDSYKFHLKKHKGMELHICRVCGLKFRNKHDLAEHRRHHGIICSICFKGFSTREEINKHREIHPNIFFCKMCGKGFKMKKSLTTHAEVHSAYCFYCPDCGKGFKSNAALRYHRVIHDPEKKLKCDKCSSTFQDKTKLNLHQRVVHEKIKAYQCVKCDRKFGLKTRLKYHNRLTHLKVKTYQCENCGKRFGRRDYLKIHADHHCKERKASLRDDIELKIRKVISQLK